MQVKQNGKVETREGIVQESELPPSAEEMKAKFAEGAAKGGSGTGSESKPQNGKDSKGSSNPQESKGGSGSGGSDSSEEKKKGEGKDKGKGGESDKPEYKDKDKTKGDKSESGDKSEDKDKSEDDDKSEDKDKSKDDKEKEEKESESESEEEKEKDKDEDDKEQEEKKQKKGGRPKPKPRPKLPEEEIRDKTAKDILARYKAGIRNMWMVGPAGCGKSTIADIVAQALGVPFYMMSCGLGTSAAEFIGYKYPEREGTRFADYYKIKAVILLDEFTALDPSVAQVANGALANGMLEITTMDEDTKTNSVLRHEDCLIIATSNTFGTGANPHYVANNQLDASTIDRFVCGIIEVDYSAEYESQYDSECVDYIWNLRKLIKDKGMQRIASTRMIQSAAKLKAAGIKNWKDMLTVNWSKSEKEAVKSTMAEFERLRKKREAERRAREEAERLRAREQSKTRAYSKSWKLMD